MRSDRERLADVLEASEHVARNVAKGRGHYDNDRDTQFVLVHLIEILGEASTQVTSELRARHPDVPWRRVIDMRNRVAHGYFDIDLDVVWDAASLEVPRFAEQVRSILQELP